MTPKQIDRKFYLQDAVTVARQLLGKRLVHRAPEGETSGIIVETEAYAGHADAACHSYLRKGPTGEHRTNIMFAQGGFSYVYLIYGMYNCFNVVVNIEGNPEAVLIRAVEPENGVTLMESRRKMTDTPKKLCSGPGKLCIAMGITRSHYGVDLCEKTSLFITHGNNISESEIQATPRINVDYAGEASEYKYRFVIENSPFLSTKKFVVKK
ncbi:MAG: DNA-3-methyladenine glycosylase [Thermoguttaceae bacterium]